MSSVYSPSQAVAAPASQPRRLQTAAVAVAAVLMLLALACLMPAQAHAARTYGQLCSLYESSNDPALIDPGVAYGAYQMGAGNAYLFSKWMTESGNETVAAWGTKLLKAYKKDGNSCGAKFDKKWKAAAKENNTLFFNQQYKYCKKAYYSVAVQYWKRVAPGFKVGNYTEALRSAIFSTAIQHGPYGSAYYIFKPALASLGGWKVGMSEKKLIKAIYEERGRATTKKPASSAIKITKKNCGSTYLWKLAKSYGINGMYLAHFYSSSAPWQISIYNRLFNSEKADALALYKKYAAAAKKKAS